MSNNQQDPTVVRRSLIIIIAVIIIGTGWFVWQARNNTDKTLNDTKKAQKVETPSKKTDDYAGWKTYTWASEGLTFKYPSDWFVSEGAGLGRVYAKNSQVDLSKEETPENFQQVWLSVDTDETSAVRENDIKKGLSNFRQVNGAVTASTIKAGSTTINVYAYDTLGGPTIEAYWTNKAGKRYFATNSTEVGVKNQTGMVDTLKKVLASVTFAQ